MKRGIGILVIMFAILMVATSIASAQTLEFEQNATAGNVLNSDIDIVKIGGYADSNYQYFYVETRGSGLASPPDGGVHVLHIIVEAVVNGEDVTEYVDIYVKWENQDGTVNMSGVFSTYSGGLSTYSQEDVQVSGNRVTVRVPVTIFQDADVQNVEFATLTYTPSISADDVFYYPNSSSSGGSSNNGETGTTEDEYSRMWWLGPVASIACVAIWFIIWILIALWAYKDAKKKCNEHPGLWFVVVVLLGLIGIIIYVIVVKDECNKQQVYVPPPPS